MSEEQDNSHEHKPIDLSKNESSTEPPVNPGFSAPPPFQQPPPFGQFQGGFGMGQQNLPNATAALVLGIIALPACCFYGIFGIVFGIIAWILGAGDVKKYHQNPGLYSESSYKNAKAGKICGMIATILSVLFIGIIILFVVGALTHPQAYDNFFKGFH
ncbi:CCC motif membrane protein [Pedobacter sp. BMA]|uniref:CCC motif membrane protein n=1 Tax=Pedobacter sp. BMA TaxID=1663685 RepID=UPI000B33502C|nr:CCC motif membrane protein [Pedobacter sp. BMA]